MDQSLHKKMLFKFQLAFLSALKLTRALEPMLSYFKTGMDVLLSSSTDLIPVSSSFRFLRKGNVMWLMSLTMEGILFLSN